MLKYRVTIYEDQHYMSETDKIEFECQADDEEHAAEQTFDMYPAAIIDYIQVMG